MLIKAECEARKGNTTTAADLLNTLRQKRFKPADYVALTASTNDEALQLVINERRRELFQKGLRWFDLKRLNKDEHFRKMLKRNYQGQEIVLEPTSNRYALPIPGKVILLNPKIEQNPR
ncbi:SusD family protein [compost metagenome]